ncbi:hypothetical protein CU097_004261 [Rhizopus azygosporus]|uniref:Uncharacterized protein n=1 Tax=Rhizopus azygosporus TaxID=86630 RepID=A0A367J4V3_RHIAZ|nr:hypothetical protein CU097_004261 [Rhizopus azygosporus]
MFIVGDTLKGLNNDEILEIFNQDAFIEIENNTPSNASRDILQILKSQLDETSKVEDKKRSDTAKKILDDWKNIKDSLVPKRVKKRSNKPYTQNINYGVSITNEHGVVNMYHLPLKRSWHFEGEESAVWSWHSADEKRKSKYIDAYTSSYYSKTDFSDVDDKYPQWMINGFSMTTALKEYRHITENGAQMRKHLSNSRILWTSRLTEVKHEWLTYHLLPPTQHSSSQSMIPDYVFFAEPYSEITFELCFVEVKRKENHYKRGYESDLVKLDHIATAFKMDLKYNGQYRMVKLSELNFIRKTPDDILLLPTIMEKLNQIKEIISGTLKNLYEAIGNRDNQEDLTPYIRTSSTSVLYGSANAGAKNEPHFWCYNAW